MPRVPVPDDYPQDHIVVAGTADYHYREADVQVSDRHARTLQVREDDDGRYCGPPRQHVAAVCEHLGVTPPDVTDTGSADEETSGDDSDAELDSVTDAVESGVCPWCDEYDGDHVGRHASSAHPDEWDAYKEGAET